MTNFIIDSFWKKYSNKYLKTKSTDFCDFCWISRNQNITWQVVKNNPDKSWNFNKLSRNPNITWDICSR